MTSATRAGTGGDPGGGDQPPAQLLADDEPRRAFHDADALVADLMQRLARMFAGERDQLESRWAGGEDVSAEELRRGLRRYRPIAGLVDVAALRPVAA